MTKNGLRFIRLFQELDLVLRELDKGSRYIGAIQKLESQICTKNMAFTDVPIRSFKLSKLVVPTMGAVTPFKARAQKSVSERSGGYAFKSQTNLPWINSMLLLSVPY